MAYFQCMRAPTRSRVKCEVNNENCHGAARDNRITPRLEGSERVIGIERERVIGNEMRVFRGTNKSCEEHILTPIHVTH